MRELVLVLLLVGCGAPEPAEPYIAAPYTEPELRNLPHPADVPEHGAIDVDHVDLSETAPAEICWSGAPITGLGCPTSID
ncbi:MAG: hypothetical protein AB7P35_17645 [Hyphomonadaceae bacterium]